MYKCFHRTEFTQITPINEQKKPAITKFVNNSHHDPGVERPEMTSNYLKRTQSTSNENVKKVKTENNLKGGFVQDNVQINEHYLDEILHNNHS